MSGNFLSQFRGQLWKNAALQKRQTWSNVIQLLIPISIVVLSGLFQYLANKESKEQLIDSFPVAAFGRPYFPFPEAHGYVAALSNPDLVGELINGTATGLLGNITHTMSNGQSNPYFIPEKDGNEIDEDFSDVIENIREKIVDPAFNQNSDEAKKLLLDIPTGAYLVNAIQMGKSPVLDYTIQSGLQPNGFQRFGRKLNQINSTFRAYYINAIHTAFLRMLNPSKKYAIGTVVMNMPYYSTKFDIATSLSTFMFPFALMFLLPVFVYQLVMEKQERLREQMKIMGMKMNLYWFMTYVYDLLLYAIVILAFTLVGVAFQLKMFTVIHPLVYILLYIFWGFALISLAFALSTIFNKTRPATVVSFLLVIVASIAGNVLNLNVFKMNTANPAFMLFGPFAFSRGIFLMGQSLTDSTQKPLDLGSIVETEIGIVFIYLIADAVWWLLLAWYLDKVLPSEFGTPRSPLFFITDCVKCCLPDSYKQKSFRNKPNQNNGGSEVRSSFLQVAFQGAIEESEEVIDDDLEIQQRKTKVIKEDEDVVREREMIYNGQRNNDSMVIIRDLRKVYRGQDGNDDKLAVNNLCLAIRKGECFGLLGPNGAGKTSTISILTGLYPPSSGYVEIAGYDIETDMDKIRKTMGLCPQHDILWESLTIEEHLLFYARLKGVPRSTEKDHVNRAMAAVGLDAFRERLSKNLSGGMKRRLSVAISFIGDSSFILMDEPTTGLDPESKRHLWNIISEAAKSRSILLTTHSMEEADVLCTRLGIMTHGRLQCLGTPLHLKKKYGKGYKLQIATNHPNRVPQVQAFISELLPNAFLENDFAGNLTYSVPREGLEVSKLFSAIERTNQQHDLGIKDWSLNETSLEEVFLTIVKNESYIESPVVKKSSCVIL